MCTPSFCWGVGGGGGGWIEPPITFSERGAWQDLNFERGVAGKEEGNIFQEGCNFYKKSKLKCEIFNGKKSL